MEGRQGSSAALALCLAGAALCVAWAASLPAPYKGWRDARLPVPELVASEGQLKFDVPPGYTVRYTLDGSVPDADAPAWPLNGAPLPVANEAFTAAMRAMPTSPQWRVPKGGFNDHAVLRYCACDDKAVCGEVRAMAFPGPSPSGLPVLSLLLPAEALFHPDSGIYVPGHTMLDLADPAVQRYPRDQRWWTYPGNYHRRGRRWERPADALLFDAEGALGWEARVGLRIHGNNTRGFPQHALRMTVTGRSTGALPLEGGSRHAVVLRAAGNDQDRAFMRDAVQHRLCAGMPFATSAAVPLEVHVNGAYWGLHHLRERVDAAELARRFRLDAGRITILEDRAVLYEGQARRVDEFLDLVARAEVWDADATWFADSLSARIDLDGFIQYMAAQMILANTDWPDQNVRYWRWTGDLRPGNAFADGRWRFIMGDSDMGMGYASGADHDMVAHVRQRHTPIARLHKALMRSTQVRERFIAVSLALLDGPLSSAAMVAAVDQFAARIRPAMAQQTSRWRRPADIRAWERHVEALRQFASEREQHHRGALLRRPLIKWEGA